MKKSFFKVGIVAVLLLCSVFVLGISVNTEPPKGKPIRVLMVGGGASHDFERWYKTEDVKTLEREELAKVEYTSDPSVIASRLGSADVLLLSNNQPIADQATRKAIFDFVNAGKGVVLCHPALWYNWKDWPEYNQKLVGGGSRGHNKYGPFEVTVIKQNHPVLKNVPAQFSLDDELYHHKIDPEGSPVEVLATAKAAETADVYPSVFTVNYAKGRIVGIALGHDAQSHELPAYQTILRNAVKWAAKKN